MKIRTDFVTNSSSTSFIFKDSKIEQIVDMEEENGSILEKCLRYIWKEKKLFREEKIENLTEVFSWYHRDILNEILHLDAAQDTYPVTNIKRINKEDFYNKLKDKLTSEQGLSEEEWEKIVKYWVLEWFENILYPYSSPYISEEALEYMFEKFLEEGETYYKCYEIYEMFEFFVDHYETLNKMCQSFIGVYYGDILASLLGAKYLYFQDFEFSYVEYNEYDSKTGRYEVEEIYGSEIEEILKDMGICKYACIHMG